MALKNIHARIAGPFSEPGTDRSKRLRWAAPVALFLILGLDLITESRRWPVPVHGLLDEPAHLLTAALTITALPRAWTARIWPWALLGSVAIDVDHLPLYTWATGFAVHGGRPPTHSLVTVLVLLGAAAAGSRWRSGLIGLAVGLLMHFMRDLATGPGVPLFWPVNSTNVLLPYWLYVLVLAGLVGFTARGRPTSRAAAGVAARR